jgi:hypothetical protein
MERMRIVTATEELGLDGTGHWRVLSPGKRGQRWHWAWSAGVRRNDVRLFHDPTYGQSIALLGPFTF